MTRSTRDSLLAPLLLAIVLVLTGLPSAQAQNTTPARAKPTLVAPVRPIVAPVQRTTLQTALAEQAEAESIARAAPEHREAARRLKQRGVRPQIALDALRKVFQRPDTDLYPALLSAGYPKLPLVEAIKQLDQLDATALDRRLADLREPTLFRAQTLVQLYPGFDFDRLFLLLTGNRALVTDAFNSTMNALAPGLDQIVAISARYHLGRQLPRGSEVYFPEARDVLSLVKSGQPQTPMPRLWARLITAGYPSHSVFGQIPMGAVAPTGIALDAVAGCVAQRFPGRGIGSNPSVFINVGMDGALSHEPTQVQCYGTFLQALRTEGLAAAPAAEIAGFAIVCRTPGVATCEALRDQLIADLVRQAGFPPAKR